MDPTAAERPILETNELLRLAHAGDSSARDALLARYLPRLQRWASGRLPRHARSLLDTTDLVQEVLLRVVQGFDRIEVRAPGVFQAYVRRAVLNRIRDELRRSGHRGNTGEPSPDLPDPAPSPLEQAVASDVLERYERALESLEPEEREILHLRLELDYPYEEIATLTGRPSADAARMAVKRAIRRLAVEMRTHAPEAGR